MNWMNWILNSGKKGERPRRKDKSMLQKSYSIGPESGGIVESAKEGGAGSVAASTVQMSARPAVIAQGNWKFVEQLLQVPWQFWNNCNNNF